MLQINTNKKQNEMKIKKIMKIVGGDRLMSEVGRVSDIMNDPIAAMQSNFNIHKVPVNGIPYMVADAIVVNRAFHQSGRGNMRHLFDLQSRDYVGLAQEIDSGSYRMLR
jgi:hypothetical protein